MYSPWICLLMMGVGVTDYYRSTSFLPDKQLSVDFRLFSKTIMSETAVISPHSESYLICLRAAFPYDFYTSVLQYYEDILK